MDRAKMQEKQADWKTKKMGEHNWWHRDMFKRSGLENDFSAQPYLSTTPLLHPLHMWSHPLFQSFVQTAIPQYSMHTYEQETGGQQSGAQTCPSDKSESPEMPGPSLDAGRHSFQPASSDSNHEDSHMGGARAPYYPGGFVCQTPYPGQLDPLMLWMHQMQRQVAYLYSTSGCRNSYQPPTPVSSNGVNQRGFIKVPSGMPQKHSRLWETQSTENMQLWATVAQLSATVARAEAEIFCQRGKISKLEDELQLMKARHEAMSEALKGKTVSSQPKRVSRKRTATAPVAILGLPALQPLSEKTQAKKARGLISEGDILKAAYPAVEGRSEELQVEDSRLECTNRSKLDGDGNSPSSTVGLDMEDKQTDISAKEKGAGGHAENNNACVADIVARQKGQNSCVRGVIPIEIAKETSAPQDVEVKQECSTELTNDVDRCNEVALNESMAKQALCSGDCDSEMMKIGKPCIMEDGALRAASTECESIDMVREDNAREELVRGSVEESLLHADSGLERPNATKFGNDTLFASENMEMLASKEQCEEVSNINGATSDVMPAARMGDYLVVHPETRLFKEPLI